MFIGETVPFIREFVDDVDRALRQSDPSAGLSRIQQQWLAFCLLAIMVTNSVCWKRFERASLGARSAKSLSWMFRRSKGVWTFLLQASVQVIIARHGITHGVIVVDESEKRRAKQTARIYHAHKIKDKKSGGFINGQRLVLILLVTPQVTIPVGIEFYMPDPELTAWNKEEQRLKRQGGAKKLRPKKPKKNQNYPTIPEIALQLLEEFHAAFPHIIADCVLTDNLYGTQTFLDKASVTFDGTQCISKLKKSQNVRFQGKKMSLPTFFTRDPGTKHTI